MQIKEIIVVEGKDDTTAIKRAVQADTIETNGSAISEETLKRIQHAQEKRGVIVFTDPDYPGRRIRAIIEERVKGVKHAYTPTHELLNEAVITLEDLMTARLIGHPQSKQRRDRLGEILNIGATNGKQLHKRLKMFQITEEQFGAAIAQLDQEENDA